PSGPRTPRAVPNRSRSRSNSKTLTKKEIEMRLYGIRIVTALVMLLGTTTAHAEANAWGTPDDALKCSTELGDPSKKISIWIMFKDNAVVTPANASADC